MKQLEWYVRIDWFANDRERKKRNVCSISPRYRSRLVPRLFPLYRSILTHSHLTLSNIKENSSLNFSARASKEREWREKQKEKRFSSKKNLVSLCCSDEERASEDSRRGKNMLSDMRIWTRAISCRKKRRKKKAQLSVEEKKKIRRAKVFL